jgi:hypothetical protein
MTDDIELPPLPAPAIKSSQTDSVMRVTTVHSFSHDQMDEYGQACYEAGLRARLAPAPVEVSRLALESLFSIADELHGEFDKQTYDEKRRADWELPDDHEFTVTITAKQERALSRAIIAYEEALASMASTPVGEVPAGCVRIEDLQSLLSELSKGYEKAATISGSALMDGSKKALRDAPVLYELACDVLRIVGYAKHTVQDWLAASPAPAASKVPTMEDALAAGDGTLHGAIDYWQNRALAAEAARDVDETNKVLADNYLKLTAASKGAEAPETEESIAADSYWQIADTMKTLDGYSVQEHVSCMREVMQACSDYLHDIHGSSEGGDDEGVALASDVRNVLSGRIDLVRLEPTDTIGDDHGA